MDYFDVVYMKLPLKTLHFYLLLSLIAFISIQVLKYNFFSNPNWIFNYVNDFLTIPLVATVCLYSVWFIRKDVSIRLNWLTILSLVVLYSFVFEFYLPRQSHRYTADIWDIVCYSLGGLVFYLLQKRENSI